MDYDVNTSSMTFSIEHHPIMKRHPSRTALTTAREVSPYLSTAVRKIPSIRMCYIRAGSSLLIMDIIEKGKRIHSARVCSRISIVYTGKCRAVSITTAVLLVFCSSAFQFELIYRKRASITVYAANLSKHNPVREMFSLCKE